MLKKILFSFTLIACITPTVKAQQRLQTNMLYKDIALQKKDTLRYGLQLQKGGIFQFSIEQSGMALAYELTDDNHQVKVKSRQPQDVTGLNGRLSSI
jgi:hypothetical protein